MLRILLTSLFLFLPFGVMAEETKLSNGANMIWEGWKKLSEMGAAEAHAIVDDPEGLSEHFGTAVEGLATFGTRVADGDIETRNPFTAISSYGQASAQCIFMKSWLDEHQDNVQALWAFIQAHSIERTNIDELAGLVVAISSSPMLNTGHKFDAYFNPQELEDYLTSNALPRCGLPKSTTLVQVFQSEEVAQTIWPQAQGEIVTTLTVQALMLGSDDTQEAVRLLGWLATLQLDS